MLKTKYLKTLIFAIFFAGYSFATEEVPVSDSVSNEEIICAIELKANNTYYQLGDTTLSYDIFEKAYNGYLNLLHLDKIKKKDTLTIIDFSQSSLNKRMYIIDLKSNKIIHKSLVSHGMNSGSLIPKHFSNEEGSGKSSLGFYIIDNTYKGKFDLAIKLNGLEYSNNHARRRGVVIHSAKYANEDFALKNKALGRSLGCPALPQKGFEEVVSWIKDGSCLFIYAPNRSYLRRSKLLNKKYFLL